VGGRADFGVAWASWGPFSLEAEKHLRGRRRVGARFGAITAKTQRPSADFCDDLDSC